MDRPEVPMSTIEQPEPSANTAQVLLTASEVAARLRVSKSWVYAEAQAGRLPAGRFGRHCRFRAEDLDRYIARSFCPPATPGG
jgi:excisionase family DNA binding protein